MQLSYFNLDIPGGGGGGYGWIDLVKHTLMHFYEIIQGHLSGVFFSIRRSKLVFRRLNSSIVVVWNLGLVSLSISKLCICESVS